MQPVGLQRPGHPGTVGWWDRGTASIPGPGVPPRRRTIQLLHSSEAPTGPEQEKGPRRKRALSVFMAFRDPPEIAMAQIRSSAEARTTPTLLNLLSKR